jgi:hypothetical protein
MVKREKGQTSASKVWILLGVAFFFSLLYFAFLWTQAHRSSQRDVNYREAVLKIFPETVRAISDALERAEQSQLVQQLETTLHIDSELHSYKKRIDSPHRHVSEVADGIIAPVTRDAIQNDLPGLNLSCKTHFEDKCDMYYYVRFWNRRFYPEDCYESPLRPALKDKASWEEMKYVVFEPDRGGWNNIRMGAEVAMIFAHATGRTLVLPPPGYWYLLTQSSDQSDNLSSFEKFYDLDKIREAVTIVTTHDFLENVAKKPGMLKVTLAKDTNVEAMVRPREKLCAYLEKACYVEEWEPGKQFIGLNLSLSYPDKLGTFDVEKEQTNPRVKEMMAHGRKLRPYDAQLHNERAIYFPGDYRNEYRLLTHFYTYLYWADMHVAKIYKRIVRDRLHYHDQLFCFAGYIVKRLHEEASELTGKPIPSLLHVEPKTGGGNTNLDATYFSFHIRRGDFQYKETRLPAEEIWGSIRPMLNASVTRLIYISTDEKDREFFRPFTTDNSQYRLRYFSDFEADLRKKFPTFNANMIGMVEQIVCANGHTFFGTPRSSFTGYITRMRGYYRDGRYKRTFYFIKRYMFDLQRHKKLVGPFWAREFEIAHRNADDYWQEEQEDVTSISSSPLSHHPSGVEPMPTHRHHQASPGVTAAAAAEKRTFVDDDGN